MDRRRIEPNALLFEMPGHGGHEAAWDPTAGQTGKIKLMAEFSSFFEALYNNFLLRDLFAKIVPGSIVLSAIVYRSDLGEELAALTGPIGGPAVLLLAGMSWVAGYAVQNIGEKLRVIQHHPKRYDDGDARYAARIAFSRVATPSERQQVERYAIIKEAAGNSAMAILMSLAVVPPRVLVSSEFTIDRALILQGGLLALIAVALVRANRSHARKQYRYIDSVVKREIES